MFDNDKIACPVCLDAVDPGNHKLRLADRRNNHPTLHIYTCSNKHTFAVAEPALKDRKNIDWFERMKNMMDLT
jgi:hypothetical protein